MKIIDQFCLCVDIWDYRRQSHYYLAYNKIHLIVSWYTVWCIKSGCLLCLWNLSTIKSNNLKFVQRIVQPDGITFVMFKFHIIPDFNVTFCLIKTHRTQTKHRLPSNTLVSQIHVHQWISFHVQNKLRYCYVIITMESLCNEWYEQAWLTDILQIYFLNGWDVCSILSIDCHCRKYDLGLCPLDVPSYKIRMLFAWIVKELQYFEQLTTQKIFWFNLENV